MARENGLLRLAPNRVWRNYTGGRTLDRLEGKSDERDDHFPEDWLGSLVEARNPGREEAGEGLASVVLESGAECSLKDLVEAESAFFLGDEHVKRFGADPRVLVKLLDAAVRLHFQVHPTREFSRARLNTDKGKTEAYIILAIRPEVTEPYIYAGFQRPPTREQLMEWIESQDIAAIEACFDKIPVSVGDVFLIEGGCPHALGEGILMVEVMEASDLVVRFEFDRAGILLPEESRFMGRDIDFALDVFNLAPRSVDSFRCQPKVLQHFADGSYLEELIGSGRTDCFTVKRICIQKTVTRLIGRFAVLIIVQGQGRLRIQEQCELVEAYDRFIVAAESGAIEITSELGVEILEVSFPLDG